jgi:hypothetical protein
LPKCIQLTAQQKQKYFDKKSESQLLPPVDEQMTLKKFKMYKLFSVYECSANSQLYHLHPPEAVHYNDNIEYHTYLCPDCSDWTKKLNSTTETPPAESIAAGIDFGVMKKDWVLLH